MNSPGQCPEKKDSMQAGTPDNYENPLTGLYDKAYVIEVT